MGAKSIAGHIGQILKTKYINGLADSFYQEMFTLIKRLLTSLNMNSENIPVSLILSASDIGREDWRMVTLARALSTPDNAIKWLVCRGLLHNTTPAPSDNVPCSLENAKVLMMAGSGIAALW